ncbi:O-antigen ligase family protein [Candidatus Saccharibacteria bacterium]|nr:O-antigen ligase family protein [Candidatus Saccharibacteria bacterium]
MTQADRQHNSIARFAAYTIGLILVLLPFHAFFTSWLGSNFEHLDLFRIWKELIVVALVPMAIYLIARQAALRQWLRQGWLPSLILVYLLLHLLLGWLAIIHGQVNRTALIYGLLINLRYLGFFIIVVVVASQTDFLQRHWRQLILIPAAIVVGFGLLQRLALPYNFLRHFGYGPNTIPAYQTVDQKLAYRRIQSTLRGANPLGAYLVLVLPLGMLTLKKQWFRILFLLGGGAALFYTYSRSGWIGLFVTLLILAWLKPHPKKHRWFGLTAVLLVVATTGVVLLRHNSLVENTIFHTDNTSQSSASSNAGRLSGLKAAYNDVVREPLGRGPGTAGPASARNNHPARIAENYFLQLGQEVGILGLVIFVVINLIVARSLWQARSEPLAFVLLASLVGLSVINMVSHAWCTSRSVLRFFLVLHLSAAAKR